MDPKIMEQNFLLYIDLIYTTKIFNFYSSDWVNEIYNFVHIIFFYFDHAKMY